MLAFRQSVALFEGRLLRPLCVRPSSSIRSHCTCIVTPSLRRNNIRRGHLKVCNNSWNRTYPLTGKVHNIHSPLLAFVKGKGDIQEKEDTWKSITRVAFAGIRGVMI